MPKTSAKHKNVSEQFMADFATGLVTVFLPAQNMPSNVMRGALRDVLNFKQTIVGDQVVLQSRSGTTKISHAALPGEGPSIVSMAYYNSLYILSTTTDIYYLSAGHPVSIGSVNAKPYFVEFNDKLIICDTGRTRYLDANLIYGYIGAAGAELITNGDMEINANWTAVGTPTTCAQSAEQAHAGTKSWKVVTDAANEGVRGAVYTTVTGMAYKVIAWVYSSAGTNSFTIQARTGDNSGFITVCASKAGGSSVWGKLEYSYIETAGGAGAYFQIIATATGATFYVDDVSVKSVDGPKSAFGLVKKSRLFLSGDTDNASRIWFSNVNDPDDWTTTNQAGFIDLDEGDGATIKSLDLVRDSILITKYGERRSIHSLMGDIPYEFAIVPVNENASAATRDLICLAGADLCVFAREGGISLTPYVQTQDIEQSIITKNIQDIYVKNLSLTSYCAYCPEDSQVWLDIGNADPKLPTSTFLVYDLLTKAWLKYQFAFTHTAFRYINGSMHIGDSLGNLYKLDPTKLQDNSVDFTLKAETVFQDFGTFRTKLVKRLRLFLDAEGGGTGFLKFYTDNQLGEILSIPFSLASGLLLTSDATMLTEVATFLTGGEAETTWDRHVHFRCKTISLGWDTIDLNINPLFIRGAGLEMALLGGN